MSKRFVNPSLFSPWCLVFLISLISQLCVPVHAQVQPQGSSVPAPKRVLLLYTYGDGLPAYQKATPSFLSVITAGGINTNDLFFEYLDLQRNSSAEYRKRLADLLRYKYAKHQIGLIVTVHTDALNFLLDEAKGLFPDAPIFSYLVVRPELIEAKNTGRRILQRPQNLDMGGTLEIALRMFSQARKIVFVTGAASGDRRIEYEAKRIFESWRDKLEFQYTSDRSVEEMLQLVASLSPQSIVIYSNVFSDKTGRTFIPREVGKMVAKAANAPVFCLWDTLIGSGVIGGSLLSFEAEGAYAGNAALDILNGKILLTRPVTTLPTSKTYMFDWRQLKRWGVKESILPKESLLVNRVPTLWEQHKGLIIVGIAVFLAQTFLVIGLLFQRSLKRQAESSVQQKTEELDQFFNVSLDLLCIANTDGYFLRLNPAWERILGYTREELMSRRFVDFVHPEDLDKTLEAVSMLASQQKVFFFENRYRSKDGTYRWMEWSSAPTGNLIYAAARDITERKRADGALRESEARLRDITFSMGDWVWEVDENGVYTYSSQKGFDLLGRSREDVIGKTPFDFMPPDEAKRVAAIFSEIVANKAPIKDLENWNIRKNGQRICLLTNAVPMLDEEGNLKGYRGVDKDITEHKRVGAEIARARRELLRVERSTRLSEMTASLAHELNQPLAAILSNAQAALRFLKSDKPDLNEFQEIMQDIISDDQRAGNVIRSLRSMMKREEGEKRPIILNDVLNAVIQIFRSEAIFRNVRIETELDGSLPPVLGDKGQLQQVVLNIIMNGSEAMSETPPEQRKLILRTQVKDDGIRVTVQDFGSGIDKENVDRIFQPFFTTKRTGLGMGLALCRTIVEAHEGHIWAENNSDGGTTFFIELPICESGNERVTSDQ